MISCIVCHHKGDFVYKAIESILASKGVSFEIIVVSSVPGLQLKGSRVIFMTGGPTVRRNYGLQFASGNLIAFFDDDVEVDQYCLLEMERQIIKDKVGMVFGKTLNMEYRTRLDEAGSYLTWTGFLYARSQSGVEDVGQFEKVEPVLAGKSASCMIRKEVFVETGLFDVSYEILAEETDLAWRVWLKGYKVVWCPQSVAWHAFNTSFKPKDFYTHKRIYFNGSRNYISMLMTNLGTGNLLKTLPIHLIAWIVSMMGFFITGKFQASYYILQGLWYIPTHLKAILHKRSKVQSSRTISDRELFKFILRNPPLTYYLKRLIRYIKVGLHG